MTEKVLDYDRAIVPQETGWWCGPASTQVVLNSLGIKSDEPTLAREIGTHRGGTDYIGLIVPILEKYSGIKFRSREMPTDPATDKQKEQLWSDLVSSINAGYGVIVNIVAPVENYPRGVKGSKSPYYSGGTVYHYMTVMGYDDTPGARCVWIVDSGFQPQGYWITFDQLATLIPPKGYAYGPGTPPSPAPPQPAPPARSGLTAETLARAMGDQLPLGRYAELLPAFADAMIAADITNIKRAAMWCAQLGHESEGLRWMEEQNWSGGKKTDAQYFAMYEGRADIGNVRQGDGLRFKGRGPIQVTGRANYTALSQWAHRQGRVPSPTFFADNPEALSGIQYGFLGAAWYWTVARAQLNALSDAGNLDAVTLLINGGKNGLDDRRRRYERCLKLGDALLVGGDDDPAIWDEIAAALGLD